MDVFICVCVSVTYAHLCWLSEYVLFQAKRAGELPSKLLVVFMRLHRRMLSVTIIQRLFSNGSRRTDVAC